MTSLWPLNAYFLFNYLNCGCLVERMYLLASCDCMGMLDGLKYVRLKKKLVRLSVRLVAVASGNWQMQGNC